MLPSSSLHSQCSSTLSSYSSRSKSQRRVAFDFIGFAVELEEQPYGKNSGSRAVPTSEKEERGAFLDASHEYEIQQYRHSAPALSVWREDRMRSIQSNLQTSLGPSLSSTKYPEWPEMEERIQEVNHRVDSLLERMDILDQGMARFGRRRQQRQRARRAALVWAQTGSSSSLESM